MQPGAPELRVAHAEPARIVVDANVFARRQWMEPLVAATRAGYLVLYWSPAIIAEASRVLQWVWLQKRGGHVAASLKREAFDIASRWFRYMSEVLHVVEDRPPHETQWTDTPRDEADRPVWNAAVRVRAQMIVTDNLRDGPPANEDGVQIWDGILYIHPDTLIQSLSTIIGDLRTMPMSMEPPQSSEGSALSSDIHDFLLNLERRARLELPDDALPEERE